MTVQAMTIRWTRLPQARRRDGSVEVVDEPGAVKPAGDRQFLVRAGRSRRTIAMRTAALGIAVSLISAIVAGGIAVSLIRRQTDASAQQSLSNLADAAQHTADTAGSPEVGQNRALGALTVLNIAYASVDTAGHVRAGTSRLARDALTPAELQALLHGTSLSTRRVVDHVSVFLEARPTLDGGLVLLQRRSDAARPGEIAIRQLLVALAIALLIAVVLSLLFGWRLSRPLQRTSRAALRLAEGHRDVELRPEGPREVADVAIAINTLAASLATSEHRQREFLLSVSHDLRTPLTAITGYAESLADGVVEGARVPAVGQVVLDESRRLARLVTDLLDLARLDAQTFRIDLTAVDVADLVRRAGAVWATRCAAVGVLFRLEIVDPQPGASLLVRTDPGRVRQVIDGLCENALRVTPSGAPMVLAVRPAARPPAQTERAGGRVQIEVRDGGPGLRPEDLAVAFDRGTLYERYRGVRPVGTGLGLAIVQGLVSRLGGAVQAGHAPEGGARFTVWLPGATSSSAGTATPVAEATSARG